MGLLTEFIINHFGTTGGHLDVLLKKVRSELPESCHIEHVLSQIGDLVALAERSRGQVAQITGEPFAATSLRGLHGEIRDTIRSAIQCGYVPATSDKPARIASESEATVSVELHRDFIRALIGARDKVGRPQRPIQFFTLNYDTLLEDALALERVSYVDGFSGGAMAYWSPVSAYGDAGAGGRAHARVIKLHGSVDWHADEQDGSVYRCRDGRPYPRRAGNVLIYPQSTKYIATQRDPFARLFEHFRAALIDTLPNVLAICGYSFSDDHVDLEIEAAMERPESRTVIIAFSQEIVDGGASFLPARLQNWLGSKAWCGRVFVVTNRGLYHGDLKNLSDPPGAFDWWTFAGITKFLSDGPQQMEATQPSNVETPKHAEDGEDVE